MMNDDERAQAIQALMDVAAKIGDGSVTALALVGCTANGIPYTLDYGIHTVGEGAVVYLGTDLLKMNFLHQFDLRDGSPQGTVEQ